MTRFLPTISLVTALLIAGCSPEADETPGDVEPVAHGVASVIDGDTIELHGKRIRLNGIDAPESQQLCTDVAGSTWRCGQQAALALSDRIGRQTVSCQQTDTDRYGRIVADCSTGAGNLNGWMVRQGWAVAYRQYSTAYVADEHSARTARRGIWGGSFDMPWDWRAQRRAGGHGNATMPRLLNLANRSYSCTPRKTCSAISTCEEAHWYLANCSWGGRLDRDNDGIPCESIC